MNIRFLSFLPMLLNTLYEGIICRKFFSRTLQKFSALPTDQNSLALFKDGATYLLLSRNERRCYLRAILDQKVIYSVCLPIPFPFVLRD